MSTLDTLSLIPVVYINAGHKKRRGFRSRNQPPPRGHKHDLLPRLWRVASFCLCYILGGIWLQNYSSNIFRQAI